MKKTVGTVDRWIRVILGALLLWFSFTSWASPGTMLVTWIAAIVGIILLVTGAAGYCLLYQLFGISTCSRTESK